MKKKQRATQKCKKLRKNCKELRKEGHGYKAHRRQIQRRLRTTDHQTGEYYPPQPSLQYSLPCVRLRHCAVCVCHLSTDAHVPATYEWTGIADGASPSPAFKYSIFSSLIPPTPQGSCHRYFNGGTGKLHPAWNSHWYRCLGWSLVPFANNWKGLELKGKGRMGDSHSLRDRLGGGWTKDVF